VIDAVFLAPLLPASAHHKRQASLSAADECVESLSISHRIAVSPVLETLEL